VTDKQGHAAVTSLVTAGSVLLGFALLDRARKADQPRPLRDAVAIARDDLIELHLAHSQSQPAKKKSPKSLHAA